MWNFTSDSCINTHNFGLTYCSQTSLQMKLYQTYWTVVLVCFDSGTSQLMLMSVTSSQVSTPRASLVTIVDNRPSTILLAYDRTCRGPGGLGRRTLSGIPGMSEPRGGCFFGWPVSPTPGSVMGRGDRTRGGELRQLSNFVWSLSLVSTSVCDFRTLRNL